MGGPQCRRTRRREEGRLRSGGAGPWPEGPPRAPGGNGRNTREKNSGNRPPSPWLAALYILLATFALIAVTWVVWTMVSRMQVGTGTSQKPEYALTVILIVGVGALLVFLTIMVAVFRALRITRGPAAPAALGLPEGSIRAVIALILILIFAIQAVFLYANLSTPRYSQLPGLTQQQVDAIPGSALVSIKEEQAGRFVVFLREEKSQESIDFAKQVLTVVGTLVVAVAGFYFGSQSSGTTVDAMRQFASTISGRPAEDE